jgi:hypothetical protein
MMPKPPSELIDEHLIEAIKMYRVLNKSKMLPRRDYQRRLKELNAEAKRRGIYVPQKRVEIMEEDESN